MEKVDSNKRKFIRRSYKFLAGLLAVAISAIIYQEFFNLPSLNKEPE
jgi:hypothetical protein